MTWRSFEPRQRPSVGRRVASLSLGSVLVLAAALPARGQQTQLAIIGGAAPPGGMLTVTLRMTGGEGVAVGAGLDVLIPVVLGAPTLDPASDCTIAPRLQNTHILSARFFTNPPGARRLGLEVATNPPSINLLGDGDLINCVFHIPAEASLGTTITLTADPASVLVSDAQARPITAVGIDGQIEVALVTPTPTATETGPAEPTSTSTPTTTSPLPPTQTRTQTPLASSTPTTTVTAPVQPSSTPTGTRTPMRTTTQVITPTRTQAPVVRGGDGGCAIGPTAGAGGTPLLWAILPAVALVRRRRRSQ